MVRSGIGPSVVLFGIVGEYTRGELGDVADVDHAEAAVGGVEGEGPSSGDVAGLVEQVLHEPVRAQDGPAHAGLLQLVVGQGVHPSSAGRRVVCRADGREPDHPFDARVPGGPHGVHAVLRARGPLGTSSHRSWTPSNAGSSDLGSSRSPRMAWTP